MESLLKEGNDTAISVEEIVQPISAEGTAQPIPVQKTAQTVLPLGTPASPSSGSVSLAEKHRTNWGWSFWLPALIVAVFGLWQLGRTVYYSFTDFNALEAPTFVGLENYRQLFSDEVTTLSLSNTVVFVVIVGGALMLIGGGLALLTAKLPLPCGVVLGGLLSLASLCALFSVGWSHIFSGDTYGLLNGFLMESEKITEPIQWLTDPQPLAFLHLAQLFVICLAPVYILIYLCTRRNRRQLGLTLACCAIPVLMAASWNYTISLIGFPSTDYVAHWLPASIMDYGHVRYCLGYAAAMTVVGILGWVVWCAIGGLFIWLGVVLYRLIRFRLPDAVRWIGLILGGMLALALLFPGFVNLQDALKPQKELFLYPPNLFVMRPTLVNLKNLLTAVNDSWVTGWDSLLSHLWLMPLAYLLTVLPAAVGLSRFSYRGQKTALLTWLGVWAVLSVAQLDVLHTLSLWDDLSRSLLFAFFRSPFYPLSLLLTVWILNTGLGSKRRLWGLTGGCIAAQALSVTVFRFFYTSPGHPIEKMNNLYTVLHRLTGGSTARLGTAAAGDLLLTALIVAPAILLAALCLALSYARKLQKNN